MNRFSRPIWLAALAVVVLAAVLLAAMGSAAAQGDDPFTTQVQLMIPEVIATYPHDPSAYTQGLLWYEGEFYESAGEYEKSTLRRVDPTTGEVLQMVEVPPEYFAEGLALVDDRLFQLTWKEEVAFVYDRETFEVIDTISYEGEGWGLCTDGAHLYMTDGSSFLSLRDMETFDLLFDGMVTLQASPVVRLNELECVGDYIYANVYQTDVIVKINKLNGVIVAVIDASTLLGEEERAGLQEGSEVLNGIAYDPESDTFWITGKHWPTMFQVRFVVQEQ